MSFHLICYHQMKVKLTPHPHPVPKIIPRFKVNLVHVWITVASFSKVRLEQLFKHVWNNINDSCLILILRKAQQKLIIVASLLCVSCVNENLNTH